jgi:hypothetical protein
MVSSLLLAVALSVCDVHELSFSNGFRARLPREVCVTRSENVDSAIYQFTIGRDTRPFLEAYDGNAADFFYFVPEGGVGRSDACNGPLHIAEVPHGSVTRIGGATATQDGHCGEVLVRKPARKGAVGSAALHFWYSRLTPGEEKLAQGIIDAVEAR